MEPAPGMRSRQPSTSNRPSGVAAQLRELVLRLARENPTWEVPAHPGRPGLPDRAEHHLDHPDPASGSLLAVAVAPNGAWLAGGGADGTVRTWDIGTGSPGRSFAGHSAAVRALAIAPNGTWFVSGSADGTLRTWDVATGQLRGALDRQTAAVLAAAIAPDETWIAIGSADGTLRFVDAASGHLRRTLNTHTIMRDLAVTADGRLLVTIGTSPRPT